MTVIRRTPVQRKSQRLEDRPVVSVTKDGEAVEGIVSECITSIDQEVMKWTDAGHVHGWFVRNVEGVKEGRGSARISNYDLERLLADCEKVLFGSHLVPTQRLSRVSWWSSEARKAAGNPRMMIKNVNAAYRVMPTTGRAGSPDGYDEEYLKAVEDTRNWCARTLAAQYGGANDSKLYYSSDWCS